MTLNDYKQKIFRIENEDQFNQLSLFAFRHQYQHISVYQRYVDLLGIKPERIQSYHDIPFLPISFFKSHQLIAENQQAELVFKSSGTTLGNRSSHFVREAALYEQSFLRAFEQFYGNPEAYCILALLPSYLENGDSSLVYMADKLIEKSKNPLSGFFLNNQEELIARLADLEQNKQKTLLLGVSYALLDLLEKQNFTLKHTTVMETGGMKGRRTELTREELHQQLTTGFGVEYIHSEYGMTELLSQAYSKGKGFYQTPNWMKIRIRDVNDPFSYLPNGQSGGINIIDLANIYSISFIETKDLGKIHPNKQFEILGRFDDSDIRGCNLLIV